MISQSCSPHLTIVSGPLCATFRSDSPKPQIKPHIHTKHWPRQKHTINCSAAAWSVNGSCLCCCKWMVGLLHAVSWASSERGWGPLKEGTAAVTSSLSLLCASLPPVLSLPSGVNRTSVQGPYIQICALYIWVIERVRDHVQHIVWLILSLKVLSRDSVWTQALASTDTTNSLQEGKFHKAASSKLKKLYLNLELITSDGKVMGSVPVNAWTHQICILNVKRINVNVKRKNNLRKLLVSPGSIPLTSCFDFHTKLLLKGQCSGKLKFSLQQFARG